jgi:hypothetical protein
VSSAVAATATWNSFMTFSFLQHLLCATTG